MVLIYESDPLDNDDARGRFYHVCRGRIDRTEIQLPAAFQQLDARIYGETKIVVMRVFPSLGFSLRDGPSPGDVLE